MESATIYLQTDEDETIPLNVLVIPEIAAPIQTHIKSVANMKHLRGLKLAHPVTENEMFEIELLIGADCYWSVVGDTIIRGQGPTAVQSKLGYLLSGPAKCTTSNRNTCTSSILNVIVSHKPEEFNLEKFWEIESVGIDENTKNKQLDVFQKEYERTAVSYENNKYVAKLPWKDDHPPLPVNKVLAWRRTENVVQRLNKEPKLLQKYGEIIEEQEKRGFIERVEDQVNTETNSKLHYISHHPVKKDSATTPIRIVYDCSCRQTPDIASLNDCLLNVPPKLNDVTAILLRFRKNKYAVSTDIEKAFLNVGLDPEDRDVTRFFWFSNPTDPTSSEMITYRFKSVLFGAFCSPFILNAVLSKHMNENRNEFTEQLAKDLYVDNIVSSFNSEENLLHYFRTIRSLFAEGGFNLRSWASNSQTLQQLAASENVLDKDQLIKILGLRWDTACDTIGFAPYEMKSSITTKREVLRLSSQIYDPLGIVSPVTIRSKMFMQQIWQKNLNWDDLLPESMSTEWMTIRGDILEATKTVIPRDITSHSAQTQTETPSYMYSWMQALKLTEPAPI